MQRDANMSCDPSIPPELFLGPSGPKLETELKMSRRGLPAPGSKKLELKQSRKKSLSGDVNSFSTFWTLSRLCFNFLGPGAGSVRELILNSVSNFGPEGPKNSSGEIEGSQLIFVRGEKKTNKPKTHEHSSNGPRGTTVPGNKPGPVPEKNGTKR